MSPTLDQPIQLSAKDKFNTIFAGFGLFLCIGIVLGIFAFGGEHESQTTFIIWLIVNLIFYGWVIWSIIRGIQIWNKLQQIIPNGSMTMARCVDAKHYSYDDSQNRTYKLTYEFKVDGKSYSFTTPKTSKVVLPISVLYKKDNPHLWIPLAQLPDKLDNRITKAYSSNDSI